MLPKRAHSMRIIALPLARLKIPPNGTANDLLIFYHFDVISPHAGRENPPWHRKVLNGVTNRAARLWANLGRAQKGSWKLWTYELGERMADQVEFEELALGNVDPSMGPTIPTVPSTGQVNDARNGWGQLHSLSKIPLIYPPSLYLSGTDHALQPPLAHLQTFLASRGPHHRRGFYLWMFIAPLTVPVALIPLIPNLPLFFCVWRSWSHYRAYRSSRYLSSLLDYGLIEPNPSLELDKLYASSTCARISQGLPLPTSASGSSEKTSIFENIVADRKSEAASGTGQPRSECILTLDAMPRILETLRLPKSTEIAVVFNHPVVANDIGSIIRSGHSENLLVSGGDARCQGENFPLQVG